jgi:Ca-activated chloride channel family protein
MTFAAASRLWVLVVPVAMLIAYLAVQRHRRTVIARFTDEAMYPSVAPWRPGWQRHVPAALLVLVLTLLALGFAQPQAIAHTPRKSAVVVLVIDTSSSMASTDIAPTRLKAAEQEALAFAAAVPAGVKIGLVTFGTNPSLLVAPTTSRDALRAAVTTLQPAHATATGAAIKLALQSAESARRTSPGVAPLPATIVLLSDGGPSVGLDGQSPAAAADTQAQAAKQAGIPVDTIAFGTPTGTVTIGGHTSSVPADPATMARLAQERGGRTFTAQSVAQLRSAYGSIGRTVSFRVTKHEISAWFAGAALAVALVAGAAAHRSTQRLL